MVKIINQYAKNYTDPPPKTRPASRGIIIENGKMLLSHELNTGVYMSPGGGLEEGETLEECCVRELREETGSEVRVIRKLLVINEYCFDTLYISNYFLCEKTGDAQSALTEIEKEHGITPEWVELTKAEEIFGAYDQKREDIKSLYLREFTVLGHLKENKII